ncbi:MAG: nitroreductase family protein [Eubacterium sp.]|nr:nitroreductase family protein [Eubacterium sp.]
MEFTELIKERRSIRKYCTPAAHEDTVEILKQAQMSPTWKNLQAYKSYVVDSEKLEDFRAKALPVFNANSSANAVLIVSTYIRDLVSFENGQPINELGNGWAAYDAGLHDAYLILAAKNAGYDTLIMGIRNADAIRAELSIPETEEIVSVIALGKRDQEPAFRPRKELDEVAKFF